MVAATLSVALFASLTGCGASHQDSASGEIRAAVTQALTSSDPAVCTRLLTDRFLEQNYGEGETPAVQQCRFSNSIPGEPFARDVRFNSLQVQSESAVAEISIAGGQADGSRIRLELVRPGGHWKLDRFADFQIDRTRFDAAARRGLAAVGFTSIEADCAVRRLGRIFETDQIERALVRGKTQTFAAAEVTCFHRKSLVEQLALGIRKAAPKDAPDEIVDCIISRTARATSTGELRLLLAVPERFTGYFQGRVQSAARACEKASEAGLLPNPAPS